MFEKNTNKLIVSESGVNDTIGAIAVDLEGKVASTVSSGGNMMKIPGRIGHVGENIYFPILSFCKA